MIARQLDRPILDFDTEIERTAGRSIANLFAEHGEDYFRERELEVTRSCLDMAPAVLAPGGGWITREANRSVLAGCARVVWLRVRPEVALARMGRGVARRPLLAGGDPLVALQALAASRQAHYALADVSIDTETLSRQEVVLQVARLASFWCGRVG